MLDKRIRKQRRKAVQRQVKQSKQKRLQEDKEREKRDSMMRSTYGNVAHWMCGAKIRYESESDALARAARSAYHGAPLLRAYKCPYCDGWHLTKRKDK